ncbi:MAG: hypothetical protein K0R51_1238 [Cytophagaceae bacterium]|jgi:hypothetical protein|nr:hypothetical protein [Cytophagaceae bacterium]
MSFFKKNPLAKEMLVLFAFLIPLLLFNVRSSHDWGGDFALYIKQGINIAEGKPQGDNCYIFNEHFPYLAPPTYSVGFPLLLAPVYAWFGNSVLHFSLYITFLLMATLLASFVFLRMYYTRYISYVVVLIIAYNPWLLSFKGEILSDIPFALFFILSLMLYLKGQWDIKSYGKAVLVGALCGYALLIKSIGIVLLLAFCLDQGMTLFQDYKNKKGFTRVWNLLVLQASAVFIYVLFSKVLFPGKEDSYTFFSTLFDWKNLGDVMLITSDYYIRVLQDFFHPRTEKWNFIPLIVKSFVLSFFLLGLLLKLLQRRSVIDYVVLLYLAVVLCFPNTSQGFRYLFPLGVIFFYYIIYAFQSIRLQVAVSPTLLAVLMGAIILFSYKDALNGLIRTQNDVLPGPQEPESIEAFEYIRAHVPSDAVLVFIKPTVTGLYTDRNSIGFRWDQDSTSMDKKFDEVSARYFLNSVDMKAKSLDEYLLRHQQSIDTIFTNGKFQLYKKVVSY